MEAGHASGTTCGWMSRGAVDVWGMQGTVAVWTRSSNGCCCAMRAAHGHQV